MRILALILLLASAAAADDFQWVTPDGAAAATGEPCVADYVYPVRATGIGNDGKTYIDGGGGVAIAPNQLQSVSHLSHGLRNPVFEVEVEPGKWVRAKTVTPVPVKGGIDPDVSFIAVDGTLNHAKRRAPKYLEKVWVYGLTTAAPKRGLITNTGAVSLLESEKSTENGDSGGGVFSDDGELLGTVTGLDPDSDQKRVVHFTPNPALPNSFSTWTTPAAKAPTKAPAAPVQNCPNGQCGINPAASQPQPRYGIFGRLRGWQ